MPDRWLCILIGDLEYLFRVWLEPPLFSVVGFDYWLAPKLNSGYKFFNNLLQMMTNRQGEEQEGGKRADVEMAYIMKQRRGREEIREEIEDEEEKEIKRAVKRLKTGKPTRKVVIHAPNKWFKK
ncbi:hypothetical protein FQA39_LY06317 [Lamprigera yunnana]|nr:hypothetical protein FQA39_LY06317 [Lamprigera yunnana]